jgi:hypothetical protein
MLTFDKRAEVLESHAYLIIMSILDDGMGKRFP